ncbi:MAG: hypothetical protein IKN29_07545 [Bacteroidales bacterium]|nr:hypothetical protein [Bacteroidales bacterium]
MKRIFILWMALCVSVAAVAQGVPATVPMAAANGDCPLDSLPPLSKKERKELKENLDSYIELWKTIDSQGSNPKVTFKDMDDKRIVAVVEYESANSTPDPTPTFVQRLRVWALFDASHQGIGMNDIFDMVARLGMNAVVHVVLKIQQNEATSIDASIIAYDNATLRRIIALENHTQAYIYADMLATRQQLPLQIDDSLFVTGINYCNHLYTIHLHSTAADDPTVSSQFFWMISNKWFITNNTFLPKLGQDSTTLRIVGSIEGNPDTVVLDYRPAQLLGQEPAIDVDLAGQYLAMALGRECPQPLDDSSGVWTHCSYDPTLKVVVMHYTVDELSILSNEGKEQQLKPMLLEHLIYADGAEFLGLLASSEVGLELRWQSRTTARKFTITFTADELINYMFEEE